MDQLARFMTSSDCSLQELSLSHADIDDNECEVLARALEVNRTVKKLDLSHNMIGATREMLAASALGLPHDTSKAHYVIQSANATRSKGQRDLCGGIALGRALRLNRTLESLDLSWNQLGRISGIELGDSLKTNASLTNFIASYNSIGDAGAQLLGQALRSNNTLIRLDVSRNGMHTFFDMATF